MEQDTRPLAYTIRGVCSTLSIGRTNTYGLLKSGEIEAIRVGGRTLVTAASVNALLDRAIAKAKTEGPR